MRKTTFLLILLLLSRMPVHAQSPVVAPSVQTSRPPAPRPEYLLMGDEFFVTLQKGEVGEAFDGLTKNSELAAKTAETDGLKTQTREGLDLVGGVQSYEVVAIEPVGSRLVRVTYLAYGSKYPLRWLLYFYRVDNGWRLIDLRVDASLVRMFGDRESTP